MLSRENVTREALSELENRRAKNLSEEKRRRDEAEKRSPAIADLLARFPVCGRRSPRPDRPHRFLPR